MSRHSPKEIERIKRIAAKTVIVTGEAKAHSLHRFVRGERQNPLYMNPKCNCCGTPLVRAVEIGLCAHCCDVAVADKKRMDWLLANSHIKVGEIYLTSRESLDAPERPLFGNRYGKHYKSHWIVFMKPNKDSAT